MYDGDLMDEEQILKWLLGQLERDEIEDVTDEMLDTMIKEGRVIAVLFCKYSIHIPIEPKQSPPFCSQAVFQTTTTTRSPRKSSKSSRILTTSATRWVLLS